MAEYDLVGWLVKEGHVRKSWKRRLFALSVARKTLEYFESEEALQRGKRLGSLSLGKAHAYVADFLQPAREWVLEISTAPPGMRHYFLEAESEADLHDWVRAISLTGVVFSSPSSSARWIPFVDSSPYATSIVAFGRQGYLEKRGAVNTAFKRRFFRIGVDGSSGRQCMAYYKERYDIKPKGIIDLFGARVVDDDALCAAADEFLIETPTRTFTLRADDDNVRESWIGVLRTICDLADGEPAPLIDAPPSRSEASSGEVKLVEPAAGVEEDASSNVVPDVAAAGGALAAAARSLAADAGRRDDEDERKDVSPRPTPALASTAQGLSREESESQIRWLERERSAGQQRSAADLASERRRDELFAIRKVSEAPDFAALLAQGDVFLKFGRRGKPHKRAVFCLRRGDGAQLNSKDDVVAASASLERIADSVDVFSEVCWCKPGDTLKKEKGRSVLLGAETRVRAGRTTDVFARKQNAARAEDALCFSIVDADRSLDVQASSEEVRDAWVGALQWAIRQHADPAKKQHEEADGGAGGE